MRARTLAGFATFALGAALCACFVQRARIAFAANCRDEEREWIALDFRKLLLLLFCCHAVEYGTFTQRHNTYFKLFSRLRFKDFARQRRERIADAHCHKLPAPAVIFLKVAHN